MYIRFIYLFVCLFITQNTNHLPGVGFFCFFLINLFLFVTVTTKHICIYQFCLFVYLFTLYLYNLFHYIKHKSIASNYKIKVL